MLLDLLHLQPMGKLLLRENSYDIEIIAVNCCMFFKFSLNSESFRFWNHFFRTRRAWWM